MTMRETFKELLPPILLKGLRRLRQRMYQPELDYTYCREGWQRERFPGWNAQSVVDAYLAGWDDFCSRTQTTVPWDLRMADSQATALDVGAQNMRLVFAYALMKAAYGCQGLKVLDWGGAIGHYYILARNILPEIALDWTVKDLPLLCSAGERLLPKVRFTSHDDSALSSRYDFVLASSSLQYSESWPLTAKHLARATASWLLITRLPICHRSGDFVIAQRSYGTVYQGWVINRNGFLNYTETECGLRLVREFLTGAGSKVVGAPDTLEHRGYLFVKE